MKVKEVSLGTGVKISLNYNSVEVRLNFTVELEDEETDSVVNELQEKLEKNMSKLIDRQVAFLKAKKMEIFNGR
jgi:hypothetical protein